MFCRLCGSLSENQRKQEERQVHGLYQRTEIAVEHEGDGDTTCNRCTWNDPQRLGKKAGRIGNRKTNRNHTNYSTVEIGQNTGKSSGDLGKLAVTRIPERDHQ